MPNPNNQPPQRDDDLFNLWNQIRGYMAGAGITGEAHRLLHTLFTMAERANATLRRRPDGSYWIQSTEPISPERAAENARVVEQVKKDFPPGPRVIPFEIGHHSDRSVRLNGRIEIGEVGIEVFADGYGTKAMNAGIGSIVFIEPNDEGHPRVAVWSDITIEDCTHSINCDAAAESNRK